MIVHKCDICGKTMNRWHSVRKIDLMHRLYGTDNGTCGDCCHILEFRYHDRMLRKCGVYGMTYSDASDWAKRWQACGLFNQDTNCENVIAMVRRESKKAEPPMQTVLDGQIRLED